MVDAHGVDGKRYVVWADDKLSAFTRDWSGCSDPTAKPRLIQSV